ncbi:hypothetical protein Adt_06562 [Abeliophyllum distichum]|uniref:Uncharacterized protein n=1 Tax=Abeliophyllum distichum TaxID=126358 RepID=A0ABD1V7R9_9LAMI
MQRLAKHSRLAGNIEALHWIRCDGFKSAKIFIGHPRHYKNLRGLCWAPEVVARRLGFGFLVRIHVSIKNNISLITSLVIPKYQIVRMRRPAKHSSLARNIEALHGIRCDGFNSAKMFIRPPRPYKNLRGLC